jgi:hypothetical protein
MGVATPKARLRESPRAGGKGENFREHPTSSMRRVEFWNALRPSEEASRDIVFLPAISAESKRVYGVIEDDRDQSRLICKSDEDPWRGIYLFVLSRRDLDARCFTTVVNEEVV